MCKRPEPDDQQQQQQQQQESSQAELISPDDSRTMEQVLSRDQRTTCHRVHDGQRQQQQLTSAVLQECKAAPIVFGDKTTTTTTTSTTATTTHRCCGDDVCSLCQSARTLDVDVEKQEVHKTHSQVSRICDEVSSVYQRYGFRRSTPNTVTCTWLRLGSLLLALLAVTVHGAPTMNGATSEALRRQGSQPKWMNPCGFAAEEFVDDLEVVQLNDETLLSNVVMQARTALNYAQSFRDDYIKKTFNTDYADLHLTWKDNHYDWLPGPKQIPKQLGEQLDQEFLDKLEMRMLDTALLDTYEYMQRYAVGLEQIAWDQEDYGLEFRKEFTKSEFHLRSVLCEVQMALAERGVSQRADVTRDVMSADYRDMSASATYRNLRDWLIFRDYMNGLEYIVQVLEHFIRGIRS